MSLASVFWKLMMSEKPFLFFFLVEWPTMIMLSIDCLPKIFGNYIWVMVTIVLKILIKDSIKKKNLWKKKKKFIVLTVFSISHKSDVKTFLKWILNRCPKDTHKHFPLYLLTYYPIFFSFFFWRNKTVRIIKWAI